MSDMAICTKIGDRMRTLRLKQNITQQSLADAANVSLSVVKKVEKGEIRSFDTLLRLLRMLGQLEVLIPLVEEAQLSPNEYYELKHLAGVRQRKRATGKVTLGRKEEAEW